MMQVYSSGNYIDGENIVWLIFSGVDQVFDVTGSKWENFRFSLDYLVHRMTSFIAQKYVGLF